MTEQTQPTDAELIAFATEEQFLLFCDPDEFTDIARAVLAKWGTPAGAGEPVGYINRGMAPHTKGKVVFHEKPTENLELRWWTPDQPVFATPQPTQAHIEKCAVCGDGNARLLVMRNCDVCGSDYAGQSESELNLALERARRATQADSVLEDAAWEYTAKYEGDDRQDIRTDVFNAFCAGAKHAARKQGGTQ